MPHTIDGQSVMVSFSSPGWAVIAILLAPALLAALTWTAIPAVTAAVRRLRHPGPMDLLAPRW